jgi:hypothetical protein
MDGSDWMRRLRKAWSCQSCRPYRLGLCAVLVVAAIAWWLGA